MIRSALRTQVAKMVEDPNQTKFTQPTYNDAIEKAQQQFAMDSKALYKDQAIVMVLNQAAYALGADFMLEKAVTLNGIELDPISRATLEAKKRADKWTDDVGTPQFYIIDPEEARKTITLYPTPNSTSEGTAIVLTYYPFPAAMTADTDTPLNASLLMVQFHMALAAYAAWLMMMYLTQTPEVAQKRAEFLRSYTDKVAEAIQTFGNTRSEPMSFHVGNVRVR